MTVRKNETPEERKARLEYLRAYRNTPKYRTRRKQLQQEETPEKREARLEYLRAYQRKMRVTPEGKTDAKRRKAKYRAKPETKEKEREYGKKYRKANPDIYRDSSFKRHHGVTRAEADAMAAAQCNLCAICGKPPSGKGNCSRLHVDHCAETGRIRGMLCSNCNMALGQVKDNVDTLRKMIEYLRTR